jgi:hypothetical protein
MLSRMTPKEWQEWRAKDLIEPIGTDVRVCEILTKIALMMAGMLGIEADEFAFMPWKKTEKSEEKLTAKQSRAFITTQIKTIAGNG